MSEKAKEIRRKWMRLVGFDSWTIATSLLNDTPVDEAEEQKQLDAAKRIIARFGK